MTKGNFPLFILSSLFITCNYVAWVSCKSLDLPSQIKSIHDNIIKSPNDKRLYRAIQLKNDMKILLVSDLNTTKAMVALDVNAGSMNDPKDLPDLSHLLEHVLIFQGKEKDQNGSSFLSFVESHGGSDRASTTTDSTKFSIEILAAYFLEALDGFSKLFVAPHISKNNAESEISALNSEFESTLQSAFWREDTLLRKLANKTHAYHLAQVGNKEQLLRGVEARNSTLVEELLKFHNKYYSPNLMTMVLIGNQTLDQMMEIIVPLFAPLVNKNLPKPIYLEHPYGPNQTGFYFEIEPIKDVDILTIRFPMPDYSNHYRSKPWYYVSHFLSREGKNSLLDQLKNSGLIMGLSAYSDKPANGFAFFKITCILTKKGLNETEKVIEHIMHYINRLKDEKPHEWIHKELEKMLQVDFRFLTSESSMGYANELASALKDVPANETIYQDYLMDEFNPKLIQKFLSHLDPYNMIVYVYSKSFTGKTNRVEKGYGTKYRMSKINDYILKKMNLKNSKIIFTLPKPNIYLPENFDILKIDDHDNSTIPKIIHETTQSRIWYLRDNIFLLPKVYFYFYLRNPIVSTSVSNQVLSVLTHDLIYEDIRTKIDGTSDAGLFMGFSSLIDGHVVRFSGYSDKMHDFVTTIFKSLVSAKLNEKQFLMHKDLFNQSVSNINKEAPLERAAYYKKLLLLSKYWPQAEVLAAINATTFQKMETFRQEFFSKLHVELFAYGNINKQGAKNIMNDVLGIIGHEFAVRPIYTSEIEKKRFIMLPEGKKYLFTAETKASVESAVRVVFETSVSSESNNAINKLIGYIIMDRCFDQLRMKEHLGYRASCGASSGIGVNMIEFSVQGDKDPKFVDSRIEALIIDLEKMLIEMPDEKFETYRSSLISRILKKTESMYEMASINWSEILDETFHFNRTIENAEAIRKVSKDELIKYFKTMLNANSPKRRKLAIYVYSSEQKNKTLNDDQDMKKANVTKITNIQEFKNSLPFYGIPEPFMDIAPIGVDPLQDEEA